MKISVIRHGETDSNMANKLMGQRDDGSLNSKGTEQANEIAKNIKAGDFDVIFTSPLKRAKKTAEIIANKIKVPIIENVDILERDFGDMTGKSWDEMNCAIKSDNAHLKEADLEQKYDYRPYGGECAEDVKKRVIKFINELNTNYSNKKILVVTHGGIVKMMNIIVTGNTINTPDNGSINQFDI